MIMCVPFPDKLASFLGEKIKLKKVLGFDSLIIDKTEKNMYVKYFVSMFKSGFLSKYVIFNVLFLKTIKKC